MQSYEKSNHDIQYSYVRRGNEECSLMDHSKGHDETRTSFPHHLDWVSKARNELFAKLGSATRHEPSKQ